ncbi:MAG: UbiD family decarboxylase, partial [Planctomycetota bacterium]
FASLDYPADVNDGIEGLGSGEEWDRLHRGRYITLAGIHTVHADDADDPKPASHNIGMYRVQLLGKDRLAMHWHIHHDGASHWRSWKKRDEPMPVAIVLGGPSVLPYAATAPLPPGISELLMAGFLNKGGMKLAKGKTVPVRIPADAEIVIEGYVSHEAGPIGFDPRGNEPLGDGAVFEGPFGDHTGFYSLPDRYPIVKVTAVTHRKKAIYPTTIVGLPPQEDYYLGKATERLFFPLLKTLIHDIEDYDLPMFGAFHNCAVLQIKKAYPLQARRVMHAVWGAGQMAWTKTLFVVDEHTDPHDLHAVLAAAARNCHPLRDVERVQGPLDILDHAAPRLGAGMKIGFDCTPAWPGEEVDGIAAEEASPAFNPDQAEAAERAAMDVPEVTAARFHADGWLLVQCDRREPGTGRGLVERLLALPEAPPFVIALGPAVDVDDIDKALFHWVANCDASRDAVVANGRLGFDATPKTRADSSEHGPVRDWPPVLEMGSETGRLVDEKWPRYGIPLPE